MLYNVTLSPTLGRPTSSYATDGCLGEPLVAQGQIGNPNYLPGCKSNRLH